MSDFNTRHLPKDVTDSLLAIGRIEWGATEVQSDEKHVAAFERTLKLTREHFGTEGEMPLHGVYTAGADVVVAHTGTSPNSAQHARILAGAWNWLVDLAEIDRARKVERHG